MQRTFALLAAATLLTLAVLPTAQAAPDVPKPGDYQHCLVTTMEFKELDPTDPGPWVQWFVDKNTAVLLCILQETQS